MGIDFHHFNETVVILTTQEVRQQDMIWYKFQTTTIAIRHRLF